MKDVALDATGNCISVRTLTALPSTKPSGHPVTSFPSLLTKQHGNQHSSLGFHFPALERETSYSPMPLCCLDPLRLLPLTLSISLRIAAFATLASFSYIFTAAVSLMRASSAF